MAFLTQEVAIVVHADDAVILDVLDTLKVVDIRYKRGVVFLKVCFNFADFLLKVLLNPLLD